MVGFYDPMVFLTYTENRMSGFLVPCADKEGPIYATEWSPDGKEFVVVYGFMPAKAMLFGDQCKPLMNFGTGARNAVKFNTQGSVICLAGFGNLRGVMVYSTRYVHRHVFGCGPE